jgi:SAM-dependent methyltransferase
MLNPRLLALLACPNCRGEVIPDSDHTQLTCQGCGRGYPVTNGIPRMRPEIENATANRVVDGFAEQWREYSEFLPLYREQFLNWISPVPGDFLAGKVILDAGCGKGRHLIASSELHADLVVGMDLGGSVDVARDNSRERANVAWVQGDIFHPPFRPGVFDYIYSIGVLHHTPDPRLAFRSLKPLVKPGGHISAWVYGFENNGWLRHFVNPIRNHFTGRLPAPVLRKLAYALSWILLTIVHMLKASLPFRPFSLPYEDYLLSVADFPRRELESITFDHLHPAFNDYIPRSEFETWFEDLENVVIRWHNKNSWAGFGRKPIA